MDTQHDDARTRDDIADDSVQLVEKLTELKSLELEKRGETMSSPPFHALAREITGKSLEIFRLADREERDGDDLSRTQETSIDAELRDH